MEFEILLIEWGLEEFLDRFKDEGINDESFKLLNLEAIDYLIPKLGPRLLMKKKLEEYNKKQNYSEVLSSVPSCSSSHNDSVILDKNYSEVLSSAASCSSSQNESVILDIDDPQLLEILDPGYTEEHNNLPSINTEEISQPTKIKKTNSLFINGLEGLLETTIEGRIILANKTKLKNDSRQKLAKIVINYLMSRLNGVSELKREEFQQAANEISRLFPGEEPETYYIPYSSVSKGLRIPARGKLWSRYINVKAALRLSNSQTMKSVPEQRHEEKNEETENELIFLRTAIEPYARIIKSWDMTYRVRYHDYIRNKNADNLFDVFPCLRQRYGLELMEMDFNHLYSDKIDLIYVNWPKVANAIMLEAIERRLQMNEENLDKDTKCLLMLPYLFNPVTLKKNSKDPKKNWRPTRKEIQNSFFFNAKDSKELEDVITRRHIILSNLNIPLQPFAYVLNQEYFVSIYDTKYKVDSCVRCLETLFKAIHALNLEYAAESKHIWHFIQELVYNIPEPHKSSNTTAVITDIRFHLKQAD